MAGGALALAPSAFAAGAVATTAASVESAVTTQPTILAGQTKQAAANLSITLQNEFNAGDTITYTVAPPAGTNCGAANQTLGFSATPTVAVTQSPTTTGDTAPSVTAALSSSAGACTTLGVKNVLTLTFGNFSTNSNTTDMYTLTVSGISYDVGSAAATTTSPITATVGGTVGTLTPLAGTNGAADAQVATAGATANSPSVALAKSATAASVSNVAVTESVAGAVGTGYLCVAIPTSESATFDTSNKVTVSNTGGGSLGATSVTPTANYIAVNVSAKSSSAGTYTFSGITVNAGSTLGPVTAKVTSGDNATCSSASSATVNSALRLFYVVNPSVRTYGQDAPATAAAQFEQAYSYANGGTCTTASTSPNTAVLARYDLFPDALSGSYVAGELGTGILLTTPSSLPSVTLTALRLEGVQTVYVMGGPLAVSDAVVSQLEATPAYNCGGATQIVSSGKTQMLQVIRIAGTDRYGTSQVAAGYFGAGAVGTETFAGAYGTMYNNTTGSASTSGPTTEVATAVVTTGQNFRDAVSASALAYNAHLPLILTTQASLSSEAAASLTNDQIKQVIVMGGPLAVSDAVVTSIQNMGISVLRIAGQDGTDTAQLLAQFELNNQTTATNSLAEGLAWAPTTGTGITVNLARGDFYPDALAGSAVAGKNTQPILLTENPTTLGKYTTSFLQAGGSAAGIDSMNGATHPSTTATTGEIIGVNIFGGPLAVSDTTATAALNAVAQG